MARRRRRKKKQGRRVSAPQLVDQAVAQIAQGHGRQALGLLRRAKFKGAPEARMSGPLHVAWLLRASELVSNGLASEAEAARNAAAAYELGTNGRSLMAKALPKLVGGLPVKDAFEIYARYRRTNPAHPGAEAKLANLLVVERSWEHAAVLAEDSDFARDAAVMASAVVPLDLGNWEQGREILEPIGEVSAFWPWRAWCDVMVALEGNDGKAIRKGLKAIPSGFPLRSAVKALRRAWKRGGSAGAVRRTSMDVLLGADRMAISGAAAFLRHAVNGGRPAVIARAVDRFARAIDPIDPIATRLQIVQLLAAETSEEQALDVCAHLKPSVGIDKVSLRLDVQHLGRKRPETSDLVAINQFLATIESYFPEDRDQQIARGKILLYVAVGIDQWDTVMAELILESLWDGDPLSSIVGDRHEDMMANIGQPNRLRRFFLEQSIEADPTSADAHQKLVEAIRQDSYAPKMDLIRAYEYYATSLPEDPEPWIALAELRLRSRAYRKAETALKKAHEFAGADDRVVRLRGISLILAGQTNIHAKRFPLATKDLASAMAIATLETEPIIRAWDTIRRYLETDDATLREACEKALEGATLSVRTEALCFLNPPCKFGRFTLPLSKSETTLLNVLLDNAVASMCSSQPEYLHQLAEEFPSVFAIVTVPAAKPRAMDTRWARVLRFVPTSSMFPVFLAVFDSSSLRNLKALRSELPRRLAHTRDRNRRLLLLLYLCTARYLLNERRADYRLWRLAENIRFDQEKLLKQSAKRLAGTAQVKEVPPLAQALTSLDFSGLGGFSQGG